MAERAPLVGVVVPVRNAARWLDDMLSSLEAQTYADWRAVVVDDGSDDGSHAIAQLHQSRDSRITAVLGPASGRRGAPLTRAHGRSLIADAEFLYFPDGDDVLEPGLIEALVARLGDPAAVAAFCRYSRIDEAGRPIAEASPRRIAMSRRWTRLLPDHEADTPFESIYGWAAPAMEPVIMFRAQAFDDAGGWEVWPHQGGESIDLLCRMALHGSVLFEPLPLYRYRRHEDQHTARNAQRYVAAPFETREAWQRRAELDSSLLPVVTRAEFFVAHRLIPRTGLEAALRHAQDGRLLAASRFLIGAVRRYRWRSVPDVKPADEPRTLMRR